MIDFSLYMPQTQMAHWGWTIAFFLWLVGLSGMGFFLNFWIRSRVLVYTCTAAGIAGTLLVVSHLGRILNLPFAAFHSLADLSLNFGSWMLIGICLLAVLCAASFVLTCLLAGVGIGMNASERLLQNSSVAGFFAALGISATIYSGFLLTQAVGITLWNTALIPLLWILSGMASAMGAIELMVVSGRISEGKVLWTRAASIGIEATELLAIFAFVHVALSSSLPGARIGAHALVFGPQSHMFWIGVIALGSCLPLAIHVLSRNRFLVITGAVLSIAGALMLRACVLFAGYYDPIAF